ncbi:ABC transporter ATP-binding protein [Sorangium sp. So ce134]
MIRNLYRLWPRSGLLLRLGILTAFLAILQGLLLGLLVPILRALLRPEPDFVAASPWLGAGAVGLLAYGVLAVVATPVGFAASAELAAELRHHVMRHVTTLPLGWFTAERKARLARAVTADVDTIAHLAVTIGSPAIVSTLLPATIVAVTFAVDRLTALLFVALSPVLVATLRRAGQIASEAEIELEQAATEIAGRAIELGQAQPVLRAAGLGSRGTVRMRQALEAHRRTYRQGLRRSMAPDLIFTGVVMMGFATVLAFVARRLLDGALPLADGVALLVLAARFFEPIGALIELVGALRAMDNSIGRIQTILRTSPLPRAPRPVMRLPHAGITFEGVTFAYDGAATGAPALRDVSFHCKPGTITALVGPSGSGKTTVTRLAARFFDVGSGTVRVGGVDVRDLDYDVLMNDVAIVFQDVYLFDSTIEENLRLARPEATDEDLAAAARAARLDEVIERLPEGWKTRVGEGGAQLSGGERQRVSIARALLKKARIVLVDEASSALDPENERAIGQAIANLSSEAARTVIVIAHRPSTLAAADQVIALDQGRVVEMGSPDALRRSRGFFWRLYSQYEQARSWRITPATRALGAVDAQGG